MKKHSVWLLGGTLLLSTTVTAEDQNFHDALSSGIVSGDIRLRYESVEQDNALKDADALTVRTRLGYKTGAYHGLSGLLEFEDSRTVAGLDDYNNTLGKNPDYSVIADPETTEVDQAYLQYTRHDVTAKLGRQVITFDNQRFVGHVGWRQDRQTFDALRLSYAPASDLSVDYAFLNQRNRIFAESGDLNSKDHLLNLGYQTPLGKLSGYAYLLEVDEGADNSLDTYGLRYAGKYGVSDVDLIYALEYATQESEAAASDFDADYYKVEAGVGIQGVTVALAYEVLGSDDGAYGFSTPLATLHAHNGWADQFLATPVVGLQDASLTVSGPLAGGKWAMAYHDYSADESSAAVDDLGDEWNLAYNRSFATHYAAGIKYATYAAGDSAAGKVDTDKLWLTLGATF
ncbi:alginate export family protein [Marinobacter goseongensis]|uniref:alginate export family protein n=1 Tax=Marinobacter goseongensis TaxID=453838 RepID=UPI0020068E97|nr:alginate export family protein [Marinobacter goseongensis]MCK7550199.1 alginate export family protein [Marinobacter goseongensis]